MLQEIKDTKEKTECSHPLDQAMLLTGDAGKYVAKTSPAYQNMVGPFGGVTAAQLLQSVLIHPDRQGSPVSLTVNFLGPIRPGDLEIESVLLRANRSNQHWMIQLMQGDEIQCSATCVFALRKNTWESLELTCPEAPKYDSLAALPDFPMTPWVNQYDMRFVSGSPFDTDRSDGRADDGAKAEYGNLSESLLWMSDSPRRKLDFPSLTALSDAFFPRLFVRKKKFAPIGTVSLTVHFHTTEAQLQHLPSPAVLGQARASKFSGNYFDQTSEIWGADNSLLATASQMVYYKD
ncbi:thioesterase family protein [Aestuariirhabdus sp. Z084]|uniref:acyl-CoA thioesterase n=1 Tax=Aestuariirhabdus haliotis TaxID=2918751 RepID=UPI00201B3F13|nr:thioesterase family protein [Aestuariirhabdus haliotis]MCL6417347.1 thioesterase family protein [Aestuariirhabdus haliotis]MCL6421292.1 thioesterase family protein [Aestuariirhabdus haliotis]